MREYMHDLMVKIDHTVRFIGEFILSQRQEEEPQAPTTPGPNQSIFG